MELYTEKETAIIYRSLASQSHNKSETYEQKRSLYAEAETAAKEAESHFIPLDVCIEVLESGFSVETISEGFYGEHETLADYVEQYHEDIGYKRDELENPNTSNWWSPENYTDWEKMGRDLEFSGDIFTVDNGYNGSKKSLYIFSALA